MDLSNAVDKTTDMLGRTLGETIEIETVAADGLWRCEVDPGQLENALINLAVNARDAMIGGGTLTIKTENARLDADAAARSEVAPGDYVKLSVSDTGTGVAPEDLERVFEPFFTTKEIGKGSGLGLSMVYGFAKQSHGSAAISSVPGRGTTVSLYLPRSRKKLDSQGRQEDEAIPQGRDEVILVVEDDADVRDLAVRLLRIFGYRTLAAEDGKSAIEVMAQAPLVDLLMTDMVLPGGMGGTALAQEAKRCHPEIKVLYVSGYAKGAANQEDELDEGISFLPKPYQKTQLARKVRDALDGRTS